MIENDLSKQQALDANIKAIKQINLFWNLDQPRNIKMFLIIKKGKEISKEV